MRRGGPFVYPKKFKDAVVRYEALPDEVSALQARFGEVLRRSTSIGQWVQKTVILSQITAIREEAKEIISVPEKERKRVEFLGEIPIEVKRTVRKGVDIVSRFVNHYLVPKKNCCASNGR